MGTYSGLVKPLLFRLPADRAHRISQFALRTGSPWRLLARSSRFTDPRLSTSLGEIPIDSPIGVAAGFDKDGRLLSGLDQLGFGYLVIGSITRYPRTGNPKPRLVRHPETLSLANSMGLPSVGLERAVSLLARTRTKNSKIIASVAGFTSDELVECAEVVSPHVAGIEISLKCPNTSGLNRFSDLGVFTELAESLSTRIRKPIFFKLPPPHSDAEREEVHRMLDVLLRVGIPGVTVSGGYSRPEPKLAVGRGSQNGRVTYENALRNVQDVSDYTSGQLTIKAAGGVFEGRHAAEMIRVGATTAELYTGLVYRGWNTAGMIKRELLEVMDDAGIADLKALRAERAR